MRNRRAAGGTRWAAATVAAGLLATSAVVAAETATDLENYECDYDINADCRTRDDPPRYTQDREGAPVDLTGYWVSVVTEDWRWRMKTPPHGDIASVPLNREGEQETFRWNPDTDSGTCRPFGAPGLLRNPMRLHLHWEDDTTLRLDTDHGMQTRRFHFRPGDAASEGPSRQGDSVANWQETGLKVVTDNLLPGYLRKNGVPYSGDTLLTEYFDRISAFGDDWLIVTTIVADPRYLSREFITSTHFKRIPDDRDWNPVPCEDN